VLLFSLPNSGKYKTGQVDYMIVVEIIVALFTLLVSTVFFLMTFSFPSVQADPGGLALFPRVFSVLTAIPAFLIVVNLRRQILKEMFAYFKKGILLPRHFFKAKPFLVFSLTLFFPIILSLTGFLPATFLFVFLIVKILDGNTRGALLLSVLMSGLLFYVFGTLVGLHLPEGVFFNR
jgi:hypothetical protein